MKKWFGIGIVDCKEVSRKVRVSLPRFLYRSLGPQFPDKNVFLFLDFHMGASFSAFRKKKEVQSFFAASDVS